MSRKSNTEQRRAEIVAAMLRTIAEHGYENATIQAIARQAGLAPGLIHYHFKTKDEILVQLVTALADAGRARYLAAIATTTTARERLRVYVDSRLALGPGAQPDAVAAWVVIGTEAVRQPAVRAVYQAAIGAELALLTPLLVDRLNEAGKRSAAAPLLAASLMALMEGAFQLASAAAEVMPKGYAAGTALQMLERFIDAEPAQSISND